MDAGAYGIDTMIEAIDALNRQSLRLRVIKRAITLLEAAESAQGIEALIYEGTAITTLIHRLGKAAKSMYLRESLDYWDDDLISDILKLSNRQAVHDDMDMAYAIVVLQDGAKGVRQLDIADPKKQSGADIDIASNIIGAVRAWEYWSPTAEAIYSAMDILNGKLDDTAPGHATEALQHALKELLIGLKAEFTLRSRHMIAPDLDHLLYVGAYAGPLYKVIEARAERANAMALDVAQIAGAPAQLQEPTNGAK